MRETSKGSVMDQSGNIRIDTVIGMSQADPDLTIKTPVRVGINGFGRIGRAFTRLVASTCEPGLISLVHVNDPFMNAEQMSYLLRYDSTYGRFSDYVETEKVNDSKGLKGPSKGTPTSWLKIVSKNSGSNCVRVTQEKNFKDIPWQESDVQYVVECSGQCLTVKKAEGHLASEGVEKVIMSSPPKDGENIPMFVLGVNHDDYQAGTPILSNASCTTNCVAPIVSILEDNFGIEESLMTTVHAVTASQKVVDCSSNKDARSGRCALDNIIPATTGAAKACAAVIPSLQGKITGVALRVPVSHVSMVDLTVRTTKPTSLTDIFEAVGKYAKEDGGEMPDLLEVCHEATVSTDHTGSMRSASIDAPSCIQLNPHFFKIMAFYDNEMGYAARLVDLVCYVKNQDLKEKEKGHKGATPPPAVSAASSVGKAASSKMQGA